MTIGKPSPASLGGGHPTRSRRLREAVAGGQVGRGSCLTLLPCAIPVRPAWRRCEGGQRGAASGIGHQDRVALAPMERRALMSLRHGALRWLHVLGGVLLLSMLLTVSHAQVKSTITPDGTLGTAVIQRGPVFDITGGTQHGPNLFHSF